MCCRRGSEVDVLEAPPERRFQKCMETGERRPFTPGREITDLPDVETENRETLELAMGGAVAWSQVG